jgi:hypothetical protein
MLKKLFAFLFLLDVIIIGQTTGSVDITPSSHYHTKLLSVITSSSVKEYYSTGSEHEIGFVSNGSSPVSYTYYNTAYKFLIENIVNNRYTIKSCQLIAYVKNADIYSSSFYAYIKSLPCNTNLTNNTSTAAEEI